MLEPDDLKPLQRQALLAVLQSPTKSLRRCPKGFAPGAARAPAFTVRLVNMLERDNLVDFDPPRWPDTVTLTPMGERLAQALREGMRKAGRA